MIVLKTKTETPFNAVFLPIRGGNQVLIDRDRLDFLSQFNWYPKKSAHSIYVWTRRIIKGKAYHVSMHRLITQAPKWLKVHHVNHNTFDNRRENLMVITEREHRHFDGWHIFTR